MAELKVKATADTVEQLDSGMRDTKLNKWKRKIAADVQQYDSFYAGRNREFDTYRNWYHKNHYGSSLMDQVNESMSIGSEGRGSMPSNVEDEHLSIINIPTNVIDTAHIMLMNEFPHIEALSNRDSASSAKKQSAVERFIVGAYYINRMRQGADPISMAALDTLLLGWSCIRCTWDIDREKQLDKATDFVADWMFPINIERISPYLIYPIPGGRYERWRAIYFKTFIAKQAIEEEWNVKIMPRPVGDDGEFEDLYDDTAIEYIDYWCWEGTKIYNAVMANGQFVKEPVWMQDYDSLPFEIIFNREGPDHTKGDTMGLSFLYTLLESVRELELLSNRELRAIELYADPPLVTVRNPESPQIDVQGGPGARIDLETGESASYLNWQGTAPGIAQAKDFWQKLIQEFSFPDIFSGIVGGTSGLDTIALQQGGMTKVFSPRQNLEQALERLNTKIIRLFQKRRPKKSLHVRGIRTESDEEHAFSFDITGKDTKGFEYTKVSIRAKFPQEELRNAAIAQGLVASDLFSSRDAMSKFLYVQDPERMRRRREEEKASSDPVWNKFHIEKLLARPAKSPLTGALEEGAEGPVAKETGDSVPPPPALAPEAAAVSTMAGAGAVPPGKSGNPVTEIMSG